jgi:hypothetical protein
MTTDRKFNQFRLIKQPVNLSSRQAQCIYAIVIRLGGEPGKARWLAFTEVVNAAEAAEYKKLLDPSRGSATVDESVYYWLNNQWSLGGFMQRNER